MLRGIFVKVRWRIHACVRISVWDMDGVRVKVTITDRVRDRIRVAAMVRARVRPIARLRHRGRLRVRVRRGLSSYSLSDWIADCVDLPVGVRDLYVWAKDSVGKARGQEKHTYTTLGVALT